MEKTISVIIPVVEDNTYLVRCINSIMRQTAKPLEIIIAEENIEIKGKTSDNIYCLSESNELVNVKTNTQIEYKEKEFFDEIFEEERRIAENVNRAVALASGEYIYFCNVTSVLTSNVFEILSEGYKENELLTIKNYFPKGKGYESIDNTELIWGKLFPKELLGKNKLNKWNFLEILRWIDNVQSKYEAIVTREDACLYEESYEELIQKVFTVKLKDDVAKYKRYFVGRIKKGRDVFEHINTYDYVKVNVITCLLEQYISNPIIVINLSDKYVLPVFENRLNAKKSRKEILHEALNHFFECIEKDEKQYDMVLILFGMDRKMCEAFKLYDFETFEKVYQRWKILKQTGIV